MSELVKALVEMPFAIDIFYWLIACCVTVTVSMKLPVGIASVAGFAASALGAVLIMLHMAVVNNDESGVTSVSTQSVESAIHQLRLASEACGREMSTCGPLNAREKETVLIIEGKKQDVYRASVFTLLTNFTIMTLGGMCAGFVTAATLRRAEPGSDEAEEALMRTNSRPAILALLSFLTVLASCAVINVVVASLVLNPGQVGSYLTAFKLLLGATTVAAGTLVYAGLFYNSTAAGRYCAIVVVFSIVITAVLYGVGMANFFEAHQLTGLKASGLMAVFLWVLPLLYPIWKTSMFIYNRRVNARGGHDDKGHQRIDCTQSNTLELQIDGKTYRVCECACGRLSG